MRQREHVNCQKTLMMARILQRSHSVNWVGKRAARPEHGNSPRLDVRKSRQKLRQLAGKNATISVSLFCSSQSYSSKDFLTSLHRCVFRLRGTTRTTIRRVHRSQEEKMSDTIKLENLRLRRQELAKSMAHEKEQADIKAREAERHSTTAADFAVRIDEID